MKRKGIEAEFTVWIPLMIILLLIGVTALLLAANEITEDLPFFGGGGGGDTPPTTEGPGPGERVSFDEFIVNQQNLRTAAVLPHLVLNGNYSEQYTIREELQRYLHCEATMSTQLDCEYDDGPMEDAINRIVQSRAYRMELSYQDVTEEYTWSGGTFDRGASEFNVPMSMPGEAGQFKVLLEGAFGTLRWDP